MKPQDHHRGRRRIGGMLTAMAVGVGALSLAGPIGAPWVLLVALAGLVATGVGLLVGARYAGVLAGLLLLGGLVVPPLSLYQTLSRSSGGLDLGLTTILSIANAVATTALLMWICALGIATLLGKSLRQAVFTARLTGATMAVVALDHLWAALQAGGDFLQGGRHESFSFSMSALGVRLFGFPGWPLWHAALLGSAAVMLVGPRRMLAGATTALVTLFVCLAPLAVVMTRAIADQVVMLIPALLLSLGPAFLAWWQRGALRTLGAPPPSTAPPRPTQAG